MREHVMKLGVVLPLSDIGGDPATVRLLAQAVEAAGYDHLGAPIMFWGSLSRAALAGARGTLRPISSTILSSCSDSSAVARRESASRDKCSSKPQTIGVEVWVSTGDEASWREELKFWKERGRHARDAQWRL
jgi:hypothetical protein